ncbi:unnamed protein product, partial [Polarella glacialis]
MSQKVSTRRLVSRSSEVGDRGGKRGGFSPSSAATALPAPEVQGPEEKCTRCRPQQSSAVLLHWLVLFVLFVRLLGAGCAEATGRVGLPCGQLSSCSCITGAKFRWPAANLRSLLRFASMFLKSPCDPTGLPFQYPKSDETDKRDFPETTTFDFKVCLAKNQQPLALHIGDVVEATYDPGSEWALGHLAGMPERSGYFPTNYCAPLEEYEQSFEEMDRSGQISPDLDDVQPAPSRGQQSRVAGSSRQQVPAGHQSPSRLGVPQPTEQQADQGTPRSVVSVRSPRSGEGGSVVSGLRISPHDSQAAGETGMLGMSLVALTIPEGYATGDEFIAECEGY